MKIKYKENDDTIDFRNINFDGMNVIGIYTGHEDDNAVITLNNEGSVVAVTSGNIIYESDDMEDLSDYLQYSCEQVEVFNSNDNKGIRAYVSKLLLYVNRDE